MAIYIYISGWGVIPGRKINELGKLSAMRGEYLEGSRWKRRECQGRKNRLQVG